MLLSAEITMGEGAGKLLGWMKLVVEAIDEPLPAKADEELKGAAFTSATHVVLVTDPRTLIPHRATTERLIRVSNAGGVQGTRREAKQWRFTDLSMKEASEGGR